MKRIVRRPPTYGVLIMLAILGTLTLLSMSHAQVKEKTTIELYKGTGRLQALNLDDDWVEIDGLRWALADNFNKGNLPREWQQKKKIEFTDAQRVWIYFYVRLLTVASPEAGAMKKEKIKLVTDPDELETIHKNGGKIYKIERLPA